MWLGPAGGDVGLVDGVDGVVPAEGEKVGEEGGLPVVEDDGAHLGDVDAHVPVDPRAVDAHHDAQVGRRPPGGGVVAVGTRRVGGVGKERVKLWQVTVLGSHRVVM